ncbi:hypothetical protein ACFL35_06925 [Candidatus Riflebacteria bacterium]
MSKTDICFNCFKPTTFTKDNRCEFCGVKKRDVISHLEVKKRLLSFKMSPRHIFYRPLEFLIGLFLRIQDEFVLWWDISELKSKIIILERENFQFLKNLGEEILGQYPENKDVEIKNSTMLEEFVKRNSEISRLIKIRDSLKTKTWEYTSIIIFISVFSVFIFLYLTLFSNPKKSPFIIDLKKLNHLNSQKLFEKVPMLQHNSTFKILDYSRSKCATEFGAHPITTPDGTLVFRGEKYIFKSQLDLHTIPRQLTTFKGKEYALRGKFLFSHSNSGWKKIPFINQNYFFKKIFTFKGLLYLLTPSGKMFTFDGEKFRYLTLMDELSKPIEEIKIFKNLLLLKENKILYSWDGESDKFQVFITAPLPILTFHYFPGPDRFILLLFDGQLVSLNENGEVVRILRKKSFKDLSGYGPLSALVDFNNQILFFDGINHSSIPKIFEIIHKIQLFNKKMFVHSLNGVYSFTFENLFRLDILSKETGQLKRVQWQEKMLKPQCHSIAKTGESFFIIDTEDELYRWDRKNYNYLGGKSTGLILKGEENRLLIHMGKLWLHSPGKGVYRWHKKNWVKINIPDEQNEKQIQFFFCKKPETIYFLSQTNYGWMNAGLKFVIQGKLPVKFLKEKAIKKILITENKLLYLSHPGHIFSMQLDGTDFAQKLVLRYKAGFINYWQLLDNTLILRNRKNQYFEIKHSNNKWQKKPLNISIAKKKPIKKEYFYRFGKDRLLYHFDNSLILIDENGLTGKAKEFSGQGSIVVEGEKCFFLDKNLQPSFVFY